MKLQTTFIEKQLQVTEQKYEEMLGCLPPEAMAANAFLVGEPVDHHGQGGSPRYDLYFMEDDKYYYGGLATVHEFKLWLIPSGDISDAPILEVVSGEIKPLSELF